MNFDGATCFLKQFQLLIHKVLHRLNMHQGQMDYEDYYQELQIKLIDILKGFENDSPDLEEKNAKFTAYASQGLYWHGLDLLRNKNKNSFLTTESASFDYMLDGDTQSVDSLKSTLNTEDFFRLAKKRLSEKDYIFLLQIAHGQQTMEELAVDYGVAKDTVYQWKNRLKERLDGIKDCIID